MTPKIHDAALVEAAMKRLHGHFTLDNRNTLADAGYGVWSREDSARIVREHIAGLEARLRELTQYPPLVAELLRIMGTLDPNGGDERHPEWPLQLRGDEDATSEIVRVLNALQDIGKS